jgi:hypothetical protein
MEKENLIIKANQIKESLKNLESQQDRLLGQRDAAMKVLKNHKVTSLKEAKEKLADIDKEKANAKKELDKLINELSEEYASLENE